MKFSISRDKLSAALTQCLHFTNSRSTLPILANVLLDASEDGLTLRASDYEKSISISLDAQVEDGGAITVPCALISRYLSSISGAKVDAHSDARRMRLHVVCDGSKTHLNGIDAADFPIIETEDGETFTVDGETFRRMVELTVIAASKDASRPTFTGVEVVIEGGLLKMQATDGYQLAQMSCNSMPERLSIKAVIPADALAEMVKGNADSYTVTIGENIVSVTGGNTVMTSGIIDNRFPPTSGIIPDSSLPISIVDAADFREALSTASLFNSDGKAYIEKGDGGLVVEASGTNGDTAQAVSGNINEDFPRIGINAAFVNAWLSKVSGKVRIQTAGVNRPIVMTKENVDGLYLVMPMLDKKK